MRLARTAVAALALLLAGCGDQVVERIDLESPPARVTVGAGSVWAGGGGELLRLDTDGKQVDEVNLNTSADGLAVGEGGVWWASALDDTVVKVNAKTTAVAGKRVKVGDFSAGDRTPIVAAAGGVWVAAEDSVVRLDPSTGKVSGKPILVNGVANGMAFAGERLWVLIGVGTKRVPDDPPPSISQQIVPEGHEAVSEPSRDDTLVAIDPRTRRLRETPVKIPGARDIAAGREGLWVTAGASVQRLSASTGRPAGKPTDVGASLNSVAVGEGAVWVSSRNKNSVFRVDPGGDVSDPIVMETSNAEGVSAEVGDIAVGLGSVWVGSELEKALGRIDPAEVD